MLIYSQATIKNVFALCVSVQTSYFKSCMDAEWFYFLLTQPATTTRKNSIHLCFHKEREQNTKLIHHIGVDMKMYAITNQADLQNARILKSDSIDSYGFTNCESKMSTYYLSTKIGMQFNDDG